jgi:hypothetical protein
MFIGMLKLLEEPFSPGNLVAGPRTLQGNPLATMFAACADRKTPKRNPFSAQFTAPPEVEPLPVSRQGLV